MATDNTRHWDEVQHYHEVHQALHLTLAHRNLR
ncbi:unnamed protein product [Strongylus vulgaris]|uniref:Uncharacterized protein n=1 Tax=Strongylus vulgaris TaxID=40348 RepID=A0A3P7JFU9_STRVU|nr:unnamed protein product [Strongylus vulgaris]